MYLQSINFIVLCHVLLGSLSIYSKEIFSGILFIDKVRFSKYSLYNLYTHVFLKDKNILFQIKVTFLNASKAYHTLERNSLTNG